LKYNILFLAVIALVIGIFRSTFAATPRTWSLRITRMDGQATGEQEATLTRLGCHTVCSSALKALTHLNFEALYDYLSIRLLFVLIKLTLLISIWLNLIPCVPDTFVWPKTVAPP